MSENEQAIKNTLKSILAYVDADLKYAEHAQLITYLERLIGKCGGNP